MPTNSNNTQDLRESIRAELQSFESESLRNKAISLLNTLGYSSDKTSPIAGSDPQAFLDLLAELKIKVEINKDKALFDDWRTVDILFQLTDEELSNNNNLPKNNKFDKGLLKSYLFFAIELKKRDYARGKLTAVARQLNRVFPVPVMVFIKHKDLLSIAVINRRRNKRDKDKDVLGKVTIIRDISLTNPHRGHLDILQSFALSNLQRGNRTIENFDALHAAWEEIFNVELLNKRFYKELFNWYFWALPNVHFPDDTKPTNLTEAEAAAHDEKRRATGLIRLLTRLIFCWFLKEKQLIPETLFDKQYLASILKDLNDNESTYYLAILQNLFFATLNQRMNTRDKQYRMFAKNEGFLKNRNTYGVDILYRYESLFKDPEAALKEFEDIPFLNGGLFECLDYINDNGKKIYVDGFSREPKRQSKIANRFFFGEGEVDIGAVIGETRRRTEKATGLIQILSNYKFTIVENTPIDQEIALDPELLGKVFEELLASYNEENKTTARKQTGSFYTPRPIVDYMVDESLKAHLVTVLKQKHKMTEKDARTDLGILFAYTEQQHPFEQDKVNTLIKAIDACKILDPACGSGAFPMGILHKLVHILTKLDPDNARWKQTQIDKLDSATMREELEKTFANNNDDYGRKLYLIENCLYGVDIQPIAIQLSKLRFFISLICDQKVNKNKAKNHGVLPLPNLETKFVAADTLIKIENNEQIELFQTEKIIEIQEKLKKVRHDYFTVSQRARKLKLQEKDKELRDELAREFPDQETGTKLANWNPYDPQMVADFFEPLWMFDRSIAEGFDLVIGNPPYLRIQGIRQSNPERADFYKEHYAFATGSFDLYLIFMERGIQLLKKNGILNYISPDTWVNTSFGKGIRKYAAGKRCVHRLISFGAHQVFSALTLSSLVWIGTEPQKNILYDKIEPPKNNLASLSNELKNVRFSKIPYTQLSSNPWILTSGANTHVMNGILAFPNTLGSVFLKMFTGIQSSKDSVYFLKNAKESGKYFEAFSEELDERIKIEKGLVKPLLLGRQVHRYEDLHTSNLTVFPYNLPTDLGDSATLMSEKQISTNFPKGWEYLKRCESVLRARERGGFDNNEWFQYGRGQGIKFGGVKKLLAPDISLGGDFSIDYTGKYYMTTTLYGYIKNTESWESYEYWLALLNSSVLWFYLKNSGKALVSRSFRYKPAYLNNFPIPSPTQRQEKTISNMAKLILLANRQKSTEQKQVYVSFLDDLVDACVMECYFHDHMQERDLLFLDDVAVLIEKFDSEASQEAQLEFLYSFYRIANASDHPIYNRLSRLTSDSPELLAVIKGSRTR